MTFPPPADATQAGEGDVKVKVSYAGSEIPSYINRDASGKYDIDFTPQGAGQYKVNVFMNEMEVRGQSLVLFLAEVVTEICLQSVL